LPSGLKIRKDRDIYYGNVRWSRLGSAIQYSLNSIGPTRTLGMRQSCYFVNVYTIVYHVQYTSTCTRAHPQRISSRVKARVGQKSADKSAGSWQAERAARAAAVGDEVRVSVGPVLFKLNRINVRKMRRMDGQTQSVALPFPLWTRPACNSLGVIV